VSDIAERNRLARLLAVASRVENALISQYLFAAFSMKRAPVEGGVSYRQLERMRQWEAALLLVARQEMEHLGLTFNLRTAIGEAPNFEVSPFPFAETVEGIGLRHTLLPFGREAMLGFADMEMPDQLPETSPYYRFLQDHVLDFQPDRVDAIARRPGSHEKIFEGLDAAERVGFDPIKINVVVMRGRNDDELEDFARITMDRPWHVRFIEVMPVGSNLDISTDEYVSSLEMLESIRSIGSLEPVPGPAGNGPATYFRLPGAAGTVGVITPMSHNYCDRCNRMRLTADGRLRPCLFGDIETDLRAPLRAGDSIVPAIEHTLRIKPERHHLVQGSAHGSGGLVALSQVGG
jgi:hypothetical protein